jgi:signal transduction histidine kinase
MSHPNVAPVLAILTAIALASVSGYFGIAGMTTIFAAAAVPVTIMVGVLEAAKLVTAAWLARHWRVAPLTLRVSMAGMVLLLMALTAIGTFGFLSHAHLEHQVVMREAVDRDAAPIVQRIAEAEAAVQDFDRRILQLDDMVRAATRRGYTRTAMTLVADQAKSRAALVAERQAAAEKLAALKVEQVNVDAQRARLANESGPALYLAKLFGSNDTEAMVRRITALLVLVLDPLAVLLTIAAAAG